MTRLDASNEPSMEDILASIRKIIAEDPPGSRPTPQQTAAPQPLQRQPSALQQASPSFGRQQPLEPFFESSPSPSLTMSPSLTASPSLTVSPVPAAAVPTSEPYLRATPSRAELAARDALLASAKRSEPAPASVSARIEPSFVPNPVSAPAPAPVSSAPAPGAPMPGLMLPEQHAPPKQDPAAMSVESQLADLLGDAATAAPVVTAPITSAPANLPSARTEAPRAAPLSSQPASPNIDFAAKLMGRPTAAAPQSDAAARDPFDFDLGPSPFESKAAASRPAAAPAVKDFIPMRPLQPAAPAAAVEAPVTSAAVTAGEPVVDTPVREAAPSAPATVIFEKPLVEATLPPKKAADPKPEAIEVQAPVDLVVPEPEPEPQTQSPSQHTTIFDAPAFVARPLEELDDAAAMQSQPAVSEPQDPAFDENEFDDLHSQRFATNPLMAGYSDDADEEPAMGSPNALAVTGQRSMEDTVAELLRPMLKSWLAENMPRIVERALRRELSEQLHSEHKTAAE